jgi:hypothetical protein
VGGLRRILADRHHVRGGSAAAEADNACAPRDTPRLPNPRLALAHRIHLALMYERGQGIDGRRLLDDDRCARDVLSVCQACPAPRSIPSTRDPA